MPKFTQADAAELKLSVVGWVTGHRLGGSEVKTHALLLRQRKPVRAQRDNTSEIPGLHRSSPGHGSVLSFWVSDSSPQLLKKMSFSAVPGVT